MKSLNLEILKKLDSPCPASLGAISVGELIDVFLESTRNQIREIERAATTDDFHEILRIAELIGKGAGFLGAERLADICEAIMEDYAVGCPESGRLELIEGLKREFVILNRILDPPTIYSGRNQ